MSGKSGSQWMDISVTLRNGMAHWPGDAPFQIRRTLEIAQGGKANLSEVSMGVHSGTHMDAPVHFIPGQKGIDQIPLDVVTGRARVIEIKDGESVKPEELKPHRIRRGERLLFKTRNSYGAWDSDDFVPDAVHISTEAGHFLAEKGVRLVGIDYLSVGGYQANGAEVHGALLGGGIWLLEGLDLSRVEPGDYELACLPLKIAGSDGAPARAVVRPVR